MIPERFCQRMKAILGDEYDKFIDALSNEAVRGARANLIKTDTDTVGKLLSEHLTPLDYSDNGFILSGEVKIGHTPEHHAGMIYVQDPGAMATLAAIDIAGDELVLDVCAAPGGKSSQIAERLSDGGSLLSNEYVPKRAKIIVGNFERLGISNAMITSQDTKELGKLFDGVFDLVVVDAPCSGEGMFRKSDEALTEWSEENVIACAKRQNEILDNVAKTVRGGGRLVYSTCTYSPEENEYVVDAFLKRHPDFHLSRVKEAVEKRTRDGIRFDGITAENIEYCRRVYPHILDGEGQFIALFERDENDEGGEFLYKDATQPLSKKETAEIEKFFKDNLTKRPDGRLAKYGENIVLISHGIPVLPRSVFMAGVLVGEFVGNVFKPSHQLFSVYGGLFKNRLELRNGDPRVQDYLLGQEIDADGLSGFTAVIYEGAPLGGGKASGGRLKNHYPKGLRNKG